MSIEDKYILGTEGNPDYLVIAETGPFRLGVKAIMQNGPGGTVALAFRVRSVRIDGQTTEDGKVFLDAWPIPFEAVDVQRASVVMLNLVNRSYLQLAEIVDKAEKSRFANKVFDYFVDQGIDLSVDKPALSSHLNKQWFSEIADNMEKSDIRYLFDNFVSHGKLANSLEKEGLTISTSGISVKGVSAAYPGQVKPPTKKKSGKKVMAGGTKDETAGSNVVALNAHKKPKAKIRKKPKPKPKK